MAEQEGLTVKKDDFTEWYTQIVQKAELADYGPVQGSIAIRPYAYGIWEIIQKLFDESIKKTGHMNAYFPLLIPESFLKKEAEHFKGFDPEVFWVTHSGNNKLGERLVVRPTSETVIYNFYSKWIRSWRDLPLLLNQWCNVLRAEIKSTKPFIRGSEFLWQEGHTAHATKEDAEKEMFSILDEYVNLAENFLAIAVLKGKKSEMEKFPGAMVTTAFEAMMPDGKALQMGTSHHLGQNFSKPFEIKFLDKDKKEKFVWNTSWGITTRLIGAVIMVHGDDKGLILPPRIAPIQVVIVPVYYEDKEKKEVMKKVETIKKELKNFRTKVDDRTEYTPGWKFNEWEMKGVPLRIEIGPRDVEKNQVVLVRRDSKKKTFVKEKDVEKEVNINLESIQKNMFEKSKKELENMTYQVKDYSDFKKSIEKGGFIKSSWCGEQHCEEQIKLETGATIRIIPFKKEKIFSKCVYCGKEAKEVVYFARAY